MSNIGIKFHYENNSKTINLSEGEYNLAKLRNINLLKSNNTPNYDNTYKYTVFRGFKVQIKYQNNSKYIIVKYNKTNITGFVKDLYENISYIKITRLPAPVILYKNNGQAVYLKEGQYKKSNLKSKGLISNNNSHITKYRLAQGYRLKVYQNSSYNIAVPTAPSQTITNITSSEDTIFYFQNNLKNNIRSIKIEKIIEGFTNKSNRYTSNTNTKNSNNNMIYYILFALFIYYIYFRRK